MRHQRHDRNERSERGGIRGAGRSGHNMGRSSESSRYSREDRFDRDEERYGGGRDRWSERDDMSGGGRYSGQSYRSDDYGSREYQGLGSQGSRGYESGWGRGASEEESSHYGNREYQGLGSSDYTSERDPGYQSLDELRSRYGSSNRDEPWMYGAQWNQGQSQRRAGSPGYGSSQQDFGSERGGRFFGRGPKGFKRSDDRIKEDVSEMLTRHPDIDASEIEIEVKDGEVTLSGTVSERRMKHLAEDVVEKSMGVKDVTNNLRVRRDSSSSESESERGGERRAGSISSSTPGVQQQAGKKSSGASSTTSTTPH